MRIELFGLTIIDSDFSDGEGIGFVIFCLIIFLTAVAAPLWKWW